MKSLKIALGIVFVAAVTAFVSAFRADKLATENNTGFAVIELFTSEGCSSCPPADVLVAKIEAETKGQPVYILTYHVDYWNHLGWRDPFSAAAYSQCQRKYASLIKGASVYTPQIVFNGRKEFIGSEEGTLRNAIKAAEKAVSTAQLRLNEVKHKGDNVNFNYETSGSDKNVSLIIALVQRSAKTDVKAGENGGKTLSHVQIVRQLETISLKGNNGNTSINIPKGIGTDLEVIAFLQDQNTGQIFAAAKTAI